MKLGAIEKEHVEIARTWRNDAIENLRTPYYINKEMQEDFYDKVICNRDSRIKYYSVLHKRTFLAMVGLVPINWESRNAEISLVVGDKYRRKGVGMQCVDLILDEAFNRLNLENVYGEVYFCGNINFWFKVVAKYTAYMAILPNKKYFGGKYHNAMHFNISKENYVNNR